MENGLSSSRSRSRGTISKAVVVVLAVLAFGGTIAYRMLRKGASDFGYVFFMSLAGVVAIALVAPRFFSEGRDRPPWERSRPQRGSSDEADGQ